MKWIHQSFMFLYAIGAFYFLYQAALGIFVYVANKSAGHYESFFIPGRDLVTGLLLAGLAWLALYCLKQPTFPKAGYIVLYLPLILIGGFFLFIIITLLLSGGKWN